MGSKTRWEVDYNAEKPDIFEKNIFGLDEKNLTYLRPEKSFFTQNTLFLNGFLENNSLEWKTGWDIYKKPEKPQSKKKCKFCLDEKNLTRDDPSFDFLPKTCQCPIFFRKR